MDDQVPASEQGVEFGSPRARMNWDTVPDSERDWVHMGIQVYRHTPRISANMQNDILVF